MASRLRGLKVSSSTIVPRIQKLLETKVLKERPLWLDVMEAYPPLPSPPLPKDKNWFARACDIEYPRDHVESFKPKHSATGRRTAQREVLSLFESMLSIAKTPDKKTDSNSESDNLSAIQETESEHLTSFNMEEETPSAADEKFEATVGQLAAMLKEYEK